MYQWFEILIVLQEHQQDYGNVSRELSKAPDFLLHHEILDIPVCFNLPYLHLAHILIKADMQVALEQHNCQICYLLMNIVSKVNLIF